MLLFKFLGKFCNRSTDVEVNATDEHKPFLENKDRDKLESITKGTDLTHTSMHSICKSQLK